MNSPVFALCYLPDIEKFSIMEMEDALERMNDYLILGLGMEHRLILTSYDKQELEWIIADHFARLN